MLQILGSPKTLCNGMTRREMLVAGGLSLLGVGLGDYYRLREAQADAGGPRPRNFGRARSCILLYLFGSPSQLELADMKPDAPVGVRGELRPIRSRLPGCDVCEALLRMAQVMDRMTVVRSMTHPYPIHGVAYATTGVPNTSIPLELNPRDGRQWPFIGSVVDYLARRDRPRPPGSVPHNIALPWQFSSHRAGEVPRAGPYGAFLGNAYNPLWSEFAGEATAQTLAGQTHDEAHPYVGITRESRFALATATSLPEGLTLDRLDRRRSLLKQLDQARRARHQEAERGLDRYREMAYSLIGSGRTHAALDLGREPLRVRESYGMTLFGQAALTARRLVEAGSKFVSVFWDEYGLAGSAWDTHVEHYPRLRNELCPGFDHAIFGLIEDLDQRGMLDETLVLVLSEHGRTPRLSNRDGGGREHWSQAYTCLFAGGGIGRGRVVGRTDRDGGTVTDRPVSPKDVLTTVYHLLGIDPQTKLTDRTGRPMPLVADAQVVTEMLA